jgi:hypothetical protein
MDESSFPHSRRSRRSNVLLAASIEVLGTVMPVKLRNLSSQGALIEGKDLPIEGSEIVFRRNDLKAKGRIAWIHEDQAGIAFNVLLAQEEVLRNIPKPRPRVVPDFKRPGLACRKLTPDEQRLVDSWVWTPRGSLGE